MPSIEKEEFLTKITTGQLLDGVDCSFLNLSRRIVNRPELGIAGLMPLAILHNRSMKNANCSFGNWSGIVFDGCDLEGSNFKNSNVEFCFFGNSNIANVDFRASNITASQLADAVGVENALFDDKARMLKDIADFKQNSKLIDLIHRISKLISSLFGDDDAQTLIPTKTVKDNIVADIVDQLKQIMLVGQRSKTEIATHAQETPSTELEVTQQNVQTKWREMVGNRKAEEVAAQHESHVDHLRQETKVNEHQY